jgi:hypothetical protein
MNWFTSAISWVLGLFAPTSGGDPEKVAKIQAYAVKICGFLPMAETVTAILAQGNPAVISVSAVAGSICKAVTKVPTPIAAMGLMGNGPLQADVPPVYGEVLGVPIQGVFVEKTK